MANLRQRAEEALKRAEAATPRPWKRTTGFLARTRLARVCVESLDTMRMTKEGGFCVASTGPKGEEASIPDAEFIAEARADVPDFAAAILRLTGPEMRERIRRVIDSESTMTRQADGVLADAVMALLLAEVQ